MDFFQSIDWMQLLRCFVVGGLICIIGQILIDKTKLTNKHGFTLIELLAVISILAVLMLIASGSVISQVNNAQKRAFIIDVNNVVENAKAAYMESLLNGKLSGNDFCMSLDYLQGKYGAIPIFNYNEIKGGELDG